MGYKSKKDKYKKPCTDLIGYNYIIFIILFILWFCVACVLLLCAEPVNHHPYPVKGAAATAVRSNIEVERENGNGNGNGPSTRCKRHCHKKCRRKCGRDRRCRRKCVRKCGRKCSFICQPWFRCCVLIGAVIVSLALVILYLYMNKSKGDECC